MFTVSFLIAFILLQILVGILVSRYIKTADDFYVAGRKQGNLIITFSLFATWFGSEACLSSAARVSEQGLVGARGDPIAYTCCLLIYGLFLAKQLWSQKVVSIGGVIGNRFGKNAEILTGIILGITSLLWAAGQVRAFGHVIAMHLHMNFALAVGMATTVAVIYTAFGGLLADMYLDLAHGIILIIGLIVLIVIVFTQIPDFYPLDILRQMPPGKISFIAKEESFASNLEVWLVPIAGSLISQELVARINGAQNSKVACKSAVAAGILYLVIGLIPVTLGLLSPYLLKNSSQGDQTLLLLAHQYLPFSLNLFFTASLTCAILSTVDSALLASSTSFTRNIFGKLIDLKRNNALEILLARFFIVTSGIVAYFFAVSSNSIYELVEAASSFGTAGIFIVFLVGLFSTRLGSCKSGTPTILAGVIGTIVFDYIFHLEAPFLYSLVLAFICFIALEIMVFTKNRFFKTVFVKRFHSCVDHLQTSPD